MARRAGVPLDLDRFDALARRTPLLANIRPSGAFLMEDFYYAGGLRGLLARLGDLLDLDARTVNGRTLGENIAGSKVFNDEVIRPLDRPLVAGDSLAVLRGNLAPNGAVIKPPAAEARLHRAPGPGGRVRQLRRDGGRGSTIRISTSTRARCWCCGMPARSVRRACPNGASCRSRRSCSRRACATCCGSRTRA